MRIQFDNAMTESNKLIAQEWKAMGTARRLQENNDQLLDALLDFNDQPRVNPRLRYDLRLLSAADTALPSLEPGLDSESVQLRLQELRNNLASGVITADEYAQQADHLHTSQAIQQTLKSVDSLEAKVPHTTRGDLLDQSIDGIDLSDQAPGYMTPSHEEEYLLALDQALAEPGFDPALQNGRPIRLSSAPAPLSEKDLTVRNPDSVYNWLRKHQPQVFLQDKDAPHQENLSEKSAAKSGNASKKVKRESAIGTSTPGPRDHDEEDSAAPETGKGRRKTTGDADDGAYRPKGGSSRPAKRKREDGDTPSGKKPRKNNRASAGAAA